MFYPDLIAYQALEQNLLASELIQSGEKIVSFQAGPALPTQISKRGWRNWRSWFHFGRSKHTDTDVSNTYDTPIILQL
jgi:hypothetical protein